jgi:acyl-CoA dehydrogenase
VGGKACNHRGMRPLHVVLATAPDPEPIESREAWWQRHRAVALMEPLALDQAILGGFSADRLGYAFASGYQAALRALLPDLPPESVASMCVTERGGGHPRAIETRLEPAGPGAYHVTGKKRWATLAGDAGTLLVAASTGADEAGRNRVRLVRIASTAPGVTRRPMPEAPFVPEIGHDEIDLSAVSVTEGDILPGDGFGRYVRPFRTVEDLHVTAAIHAYLIREIRLHGLPRTLAERFAALLVALRGLVHGDPASPEVHVALAGVLGLSRTLIDELDRIWGKTESPAHARWERDRLLLSVAASVRERRIDRAWERLARLDSVADESTGSSGMDAPPWARGAS